MLKFVVNYNFHFILYIDDINPSTASGQLRKCADISINNYDMVFLYDLVFFHPNCCNFA